MKNELIITTRVKKLISYLNDFERGQISVPAFQRDFLWETKMIVDLFDSISKGYPIGSILFWKPYPENIKNANKFEFNKIGSYYLPEKANDYYYILDGYQRLSTLFGCLVNPDKTELKRDDDEWKRKYNLIFNLENNEIQPVRKKNLDIHEVELYKFIDGMEFYHFQQNMIKLDLPAAKAALYIERYRDFGAKLTNYDIPCIELTGGSIEEAIDIFTRLNSQGTKITNDWKISALSYNNEYDFRLATEIDKLLINISKYNFEKLSRKVVFQSITNSFGAAFFDATSQNDIKKLIVLAKNEQFIQTSRTIISVIPRAISFLHHKLNVLNNKLLPYNNQLIFIADFFNKIENPSKTQLAALEKWFWITSYSNYFTRYNLSKQRQAYKQFQDFINNEDKNPIFYDNEEKTFETIPFPHHIDLGSVRSKTLVLFMLREQMKNWKDDKSINVFKSYKLFKGISDKIFENTLYVVNIFDLPKAEKDVLLWLENLDTDIPELFINKEIQIAIKNGVTQEKILQLRKQLIISKEREFVNELGLKYIEI